MSFRVITNITPQLITRKALLTFESPVKQNLSQSPEGARRPSAIVSIVFYSYSPEGVTCLAEPTPYWLDIANFPYPFSFSAVVRGDPFRILSNLWKSFTVPETRVFQATDGKDLVILACTVFDWSTRVTDRRTDRQTDRTVMAKTRLRVKK